MPASAPAFLGGFNGSHPGELLQPPVMQAPMPVPAVGPAYAPMAGTMPVGIPASVPEEGPFFPAQPVRPLASLHVPESGCSMSAAAILGACR